jgi:hypothetical protein
MGMGREQVTPAAMGKGEAMAMATAREEMAMETFRGEDTAMELAVEVVTSMALEAIMTAEEMQAGADGDVVEGEFVGVETEGRMGGWRR